MSVPVRLTKKPSLTGEPLALLAPLAAVVLLPLLADPPPLELVLLLLLLDPHAASSTVDRKGSTSRPSFLRRRLCVAWSNGLVACGVDSDL